MQPGLHDFDEGYFDLRTIYYFRRALVEYEQVHQVNLIQEAMDKITDGQLAKLQIKTGFQRMDSTLVQSNIRNMSRLQLLVELIIRFHRLLTEGEKEKYHKQFSAYISESSEQYCYKLKGAEAAGHLERAGKSFQWILRKFEKYQHSKEYQNLKRAFEEQFNVEEKEIVPKENKELKGSNLQSPDDTQATYRKKKGEGSKGYVSNITKDL